MERGLAIVAIVDDDDVVCRAISRLVRSFSYSPAAFSSGRSFLASLGAGPPDCVLLDLYMPEMNGVDVLRSMRDARIALPAILMSGSDRPGVGEECLRAGAVAYLPKPLNSADLHEALKGALSAAGKGDASQGTIPRRCTPTHTT